MLEVCAISCHINITFCLLDSWSARPILYVKADKNAIFQKDFSIWSEVRVFGKMLFFSVEKVKPEKRGRQKLFLKRRVSRSKAGKKGVKNFLKFGRYTCTHTHSLVINRILTWSLSSVAMSEASACLSTHSDRDRASRRTKREERCWWGERQRDPLHTPQGIQMHAKSMTRSSVYPRYGGSFVWVP